MNNKKEMPPVLGKFVRREIEGIDRNGVTIVRHNLSIMDSVDEGHNPYDKSGPRPTEAQTEEAIRRRKSGRLRK